MSKTPNFDSIKRFDENSLEYWSARDLMPLLGYRKNWQNFEHALQKAMEACKSNNEAVENHFNASIKMVQLGSGAERDVNDYNLSRLACYLVAMNGNSRKAEVAAAQQYFAVQTRRQELADELASLPENKKRIRYRRDIKRLNSELQDTARDAGVISRQEFADFQDQGYIGLYNGLRENDIHERKALKPKDKILDYMGSEKLGANIFRATQTDAKIRHESIRGKENANQAHLDMGRRVRQFIAEGGGAMPEKSIRQLQKEDEKEEKRRLYLQQQPQLPSFADDIERLL
jgi:DNA-damage-inducible protein D